MLQWKLHKIELDLSFQWKIARGATSKKELHFVEVSDGRFRGIGEISGITQSKTVQTENDFELFIKNNNPILTSIENSSLASAIKFGLSSALTHLECQKSNERLWEHLKAPRPTKVQTSFSVPIMPGSQVWEFFKKNNLDRYTAIKIKIDSSNYQELLAAISQLTRKPLRIDANEAFETVDQVLQFFQAIKKHNIEFIEQPMPRALDPAMNEVKKKSPYILIADESLQSCIPHADLAERFHGINIKLMKAGSYQKALAQIQWAKKHNLKTMLGCMVETSLGILGAYSISAPVDYCDLDGFLFFKNEPFGLLKENEGSIDFGKELDTMSSFFGNRDQAL